jgi:hypothetical protein
VSEPSFPESARVGDAGEIAARRFALRIPPELTPEIATRRWRELNRLLHTLVFLPSEIRESRSCEPLLRGAGALVSAARGLLYLRGESDALRLCAHVGFPSGPPDRLLTHGALVAAGLASRKPILVEAPPEGILGEEVWSLGEPSALAVPLFADAHPRGVVLLGRSQPFSEDDAVLLWCFALILEELLPDALSGRSPAAEPGACKPERGILGWSAFEARLDREIERCRWTGRSLSLVRLARTPRGPLGSAEREPGLLLQERVLRALRRSLRPSDFFTCWAEEDLLIALPDAGPETARRMAQAIRRNLIQSGAVGAGTLVAPGLRVDCASTDDGRAGRNDLLGELGCVSGTRSPRG